MISIIITARDEPETVAQLVADLEKEIPNLGEHFEILIICPDEKTKKAALKNDCLDLVKWVRDKGKGKPAAINIGLKKAKGKILIMTDGDVVIGSGAIGYLLARFNSPRVGAVSGRPVAMNSKNNLFGYWAHLLTEAGAHQQRLEQEKKNAFVDASGYLMAVRKGLVTAIPADSLADDAVISRITWDKGYFVRYAPKARVYVKFPDNFSDWLIQKKRSAGGYFRADKMRGFLKESWGIWRALSYPRGVKELFWTFLLILARLYLWLAIFWERKIINKPFNQTWVRVESTK